MKARVLRTLALAGAAWWMAGCGHPVQKKLEGRWHGERVENVDDQHIAMTTGWAKGTTLEFAGSSITIAIPAEEPRSATYEVANVQGKEVQLRIQGDDGDIDETRLLLDGQETLRWDIGGGRHIVLRRDL